jgi:hypothetical protein
MEKITLKLFEFYGLDAELNGAVNQQTGEKLSSGLLQEKLSLVTKYWLTDLAKKVASEKAAIEELKNDLIKKYGKADERGGVTIPMVIDELDEEGNQIPADSHADGKTSYRKILNPDYQAFEKDFNELLQTEKDLEYKKLKLDDFEKVETSDNYGTFFKLLSIEEAPVVSMAK